MKKQVRTKIIAVPTYKRKKKGGKRKSRTVQGHEKTIKTVDCPYCAMSIIAQDIHCIACGRMFTPSDRKRLLTNG